MVTFMTGEQVDINTLQTKCTRSLSETLTLILNAQAATIAISSQKMNCTITAKTTSRHSTEPR